MAEYFNKQPRISVISTSSKDGKVDSAVYGSPQMIDEKTVIVALSQMISLASCRKEPVFYLI